MTVPAMAKARALVADIGGTNARFALADLDTLDLTEIRQFRVADYPGLREVASAYLGDFKERPRMAAIAVAAPVVGDDISLTNSPWTFNRAALGRALGLDTLLVLNDFAALAQSLPHLRPQDLRQIGGTTPPPHATKLVLGPGTGIGVAGLVWGGSDWIAVPSEGGHLTLAANNARELELAELLRAGRGRLSVERAISGPGLTGLYAAIAASHGQTVTPPTTNEVMIRGTVGADPIAVEALQTFIAWLGAFAGDAALMFGARGGVYIGGGIAPRIAEALSAPAFRQAFEEKGRLSGFLAPIPIYVIPAEFATLKGAAAALRSSLAKGEAGLPVSSP